MFYIVESDIHYIIRIFIDFVSRSGEIFQKVPLSGILLLLSGRSAEVALSGQIFLPIVSL